MPDGVRGTFPWTLADTPFGTAVTLARRYQLPQADLVDDALAPHRTRTGTLTCRHLAGRQAHPVVTPNALVRRCTPCARLILDAPFTERYEEIEVAASVAHWTAWLATSPSPSAAATLASVLTLIADEQRQLLPAAQQRLAPLLDQARAHLARVPAGFEPDRWARIADRGITDEALGAWADAISSGATPRQAAAYCRWLGRRARRRRAAGPSTGARYIVWADPLFRSMTWPDPGVADRLKAALASTPANRHIWAIAGPPARAIETVWRAQHTRGIAILDATDARDDIAALATTLWQRAHATMACGSAPDAVATATTLVDDPAAAYTATQLVAEWVGTGAALAQTALALAADDPAPTAPPSP